MTRGHMFHTPQIPGTGIDQNWNHQLPESRFNPVGGVSSMTRMNSSLRSNDLPFPSFNSGNPTHRTANTGALQDTYLYPTSSSGYTQALPSYVQHVPPCYNPFTVGGMSSNSDPSADFGRPPFKRKNPGFPMEYNSSGSSSNPQPSSYHLQPDLVQGPQFWPRNPICGSDGLLLAEGSQRNVRTRYSHPLHLEMDQSGSHQSNFPVHHIPTPNISVSAATGLQWTQVPSSDIGRFNHGMNHPQAVNRFPTSSMEVDRGYQTTAYMSRNPIAPFPTSQGPTTWGNCLGHGIYGQRTTSHSPFPSYRPLGFAAALGDGRWSGVEPAAPSIHSRPLSIGEHASERIGRNMYNRFPPFLDEENNHNRSVTEGIPIIDPPMFYNSGDLFDQHHDMRLDIDNMSYEELLALGERIGKVNTGLSEEKVSKCLSEAIYCSDLTQDEEGEVNCVICMEECKDRDGLGKLSCGHDFHSNCIKKWLLIKNFCPICRASAMEGNAEDT